MTRRNVGPQFEFFSPAMYGQEEGGRYRRSGYRKLFRTSELAEGQRQLERPVRCRCGGMIVIVPCLACGHDPTQETNHG